MLTEYTARVFHWGVAIDEFTTTRLEELQEHYMKWFLDEEDGEIYYAVYKDGRECGFMETINLLRDASSAAEAALYGVKQEANK